MAEAPPMDAVTLRGADRFIVNTAAYMKGQSVERWLIDLNGRGFHHFELTAAPGFLWPGDMDKAGSAHFRRFLAGHRLRIVARALKSGTPATRDLPIRLVELAGDLGAAGAVVSPAAASPENVAGRELTKDGLFAVLDRLVPIAEQAGTQLWIEAERVAGQDHADALMQLLDDYGDPRIGVVFDVTPGLPPGLDWPAVLRRFAPRLKLVRLGEATAAGLEALPALLAEIGYTDWPVLQLPNANPDTALASHLARLLTLGFGCEPTPAATGQAAR